MILEINKRKDLFTHFLKESTERIQKVKKELILDKNTGPKQLDLLMREFHTLKAGAYNFSLVELAEKAHEIEDFLKGAGEKSETQFSNELCS